MLTTTEYIESLIFVYMDCFNTYSTLLNPTTKATNSITKHNYAKRFALLFEEQFQVPLLQLERERDEA